MSTVFPLNHPARRLRGRVLLAWLLQPVLSLAVLVSIGMLTLAQVTQILRAPPLPAFVVVATLLAWRFFDRYSPEPKSQQAGISLFGGRHSLRFLPFFLWGAFVLYSLVVGALLLLSADWYTEFTARPVDWLGSQLVALLLTLMVGLPLFSPVLSQLESTPTNAPMPGSWFVTLKRALLFGISLCLLAVTILAYYHWVRSEYVMTELLIFWLSLVGLCVAAGAWLLMKSDAMVGAWFSQIFPHRISPAEVARQAVVTTLNDDQVRLLLDSTVEAIYGIDPQGRCTFANRACLSLLGYESAAELLGRSMHDLMHHTRPDGNPCSAATCTLHSRPLMGSTDHHVDDLFWREDGTSVPVEYWAHPIYEDGHITGAVVTFIDVTERNTVEQGLQRLHARNELLIESTSDGIIGVDAALRCTFANRAAGELLGYSQDQVIGKDIHRLVHHSDEAGRPLSCDELPLYHAVAEQTTQHTDSAVLWRAEGSFIPVQYSANPILEDGRVTGAVMIFRNIAEARETAREMDYLASHDPLTGLFNRREFEHRLEQALQSARRDKNAHALCYIDLDQFKVVNDTCGHEAGDELLRQLAALLHDHVRQHDMLARLGGDEFGLLLDSCPLGKAMGIADGLRAVVEDYRFVWQDKSFAVGVSIGLVAIAAETESVSIALRDADAACYMAKDGGRNRVHVYELHDEELTRRRGEMQWLSRLNWALDNDKFELRFQPIVAVARPDDRQRSIEILLSMRDSDGRVIPPGAFIPAAERYNMMTVIDRWVVRKVFAWLREHHASLDHLSYCFINLSGQSVGQEQFLGFLIEELGRGGFPTEKLCFEVTETAAVANLSRAVLFINALKYYGCRFALDDFGSGMSSFAYLKKLPLHFLKIDGNFVRDMATDPVDRAMVQAIHQVGHVMQISTIAEFVQDDDILAELREIGVDYAQGFGLARPRPLSEYFNE